MFRRLTVQLRNFPLVEKKQLVTAFGSLLLGLSTVVVASAFIQIELNQAVLSKNIDRIFQINKWLEKPDGERLSSNKTAGLLAPALNHQVPEMERIARMMTWPEEIQLQATDRATTTKTWCFVDPTFIDVFDIQFIKGDAANALNKPGQVVLSEPVARQLFGTSDIIGRSFTGLGGKTYRVSGVIPAPAKQSKVQYAALASWASTEKNSGMHDFRFMNNWIGQTVETFVLLHHAEEANAAENHLLEVIRESAPGQAGNYPFFLHPLMPATPKSGAVGAASKEKFSDLFWGAGSVLLLFQHNTFLS